jgi:hypothetical protein
MKGYGVEIQLHTLLPPVMDGVSGQLHTPEHEHPPPIQQVAG